MGLGFGLYYSWWLVRYYPTLRWGRKGKVEDAGPTAEGKLAGKDRRQAATPILVEKVRTAPAEGITAKAEVGEVIGKPDQAIPADKQGSLQLELPVPAVIQEPVFLPTLMGDLVMAITRLAGSARDDRAIELDLVPAFRQLLSREPYQKLRGTTFEPKVVEHIVHELKRHGLIAVDAMTVREWWT